MQSLKKIIQNDVATLEVDLYGGAMTLFELRKCEVNPLSFRFSEEQMPVNNRGGAAYQGHFLCLGRWGEPSPGEIMKGLPDHGEFANIQWQVSQEQRHSISMETTGRLEGLHIGRKIVMDPAQPVYSVMEQVTNINPLGRLYQMVQHPTLAAPFLDNNTIVNCNASVGFNYTSYGHPEEHTSQWPSGINADKSIVDLRTPRTATSSVFSFIVRKEDELGWITAYSPKDQLLLGYAWQRKDYPWINLWIDFAGDTIRYRGLEFGTSGIHQPFRQILEDGNLNVFGERTMDYIDAGETKSRSFISFLYKPPAGFNTVNSVQLSGTSLVITGPSSVYQLPLGPVFL